MSNFLEMTSEAGPLYLLGFQRERNIIIAWGYVSDHPLPRGARLRDGRDSYEADVPLLGELVLFGDEEDPPFVQLEEPLILRKVMAYGKQEKRH